MKANFTYLRNGVYLASIAGDTSKAVAALKAVKADGISPASGYQTTTTGYLGVNDIDALQNALKKNV